MSRLLYPIWCLFSLPGIAYAIGASEPIEMVSSYRNIMIEGKTYSGKPFKVEAQCTDYDKAKQHIDTERSLLLTDGFTPECLITKLNLAIQNQQFNIPVSSYEYMANVNLRKIFVGEKGQIFVLHLRGGDGTWSYKSSFSFDSDGLRYKETEFIDSSGELVTKREYVRSGLNTEKKSPQPDLNTRAVF
jgi:hypothetical protein